MAFIYHNIKHGPYTLSEWKEKLEIDLSEEMDFIALGEKEREVSSKYAAVKNNLFLAKGAYRAASASKERNYSAAYSKVVGGSSDGKRKAAATVEQEVMTQIESEMDALLYAETLMDFWSTQESIVSAKRETLKNLFWIVKESYQVEKS
jgi:hypothetical protein